VAGGGAGRIRDKKERVRGGGERGSHAPINGVQGEAAQRHLLY